jgi:hypothetical protein
MISWDLPVGFRRFFQSVSQSDDFAAKRHIGIYAGRFPTVSCGLNPNSLLGFGLSITNEPFPD